MLKEEKELRKYLRESVTDDYPDEFKEIRKEWGRLITALVRAVREDCAKVVMEHDCDGRGSIAVAIRSRK